MAATLYTDILEQAEASGLIVMGALHPGRVAAKALQGGTLILLGAGKGFWPAFSAASESRDGQRDPVDRWSRRVAGTLAKRFDAQAHFPFGGPPYAPFIDWAQKSGRAFTSPTGMLVHDTVGLMISYRGALHLATEIAFPAVTGQSPCQTCAGQPCTTACPVGALGAAQSYDLAACHDYLDSAAGADCMARGCAARRACPLSAGAGRSDAQSALHMRSFHRH
ncbi:ferredoxin [Pontibaca salina]|uniref:Ferredoxin n=1 Tax=Pontibaca salina TaxID=2795731 RepID=A0A934HU69_9RHOB|nr:ferredoxin [Pontibaca salina]MBI6630308.1 ferredoxin [Pontibaca salina]